MPPPNRAPVALLTGPTTAIIGQQAVFDGSASHDPDHPKLASWRLLLSTGDEIQRGKGQPPNAIEWTPEVTDLGTLDVLLEVTDRHQITATSLPITVEVVPIPEPEPIPPLQVTCPDPITVEATSAEGVIVVYPEPVTSGGVPPYDVVTTPPSGSVFPVGETVVAVTVTDAEGTVVNCTFPVTILPQVIPPDPLTIMATTLPSAIKNSPYFQQIAVSGGLQPYSFAVIAGSLPTGLSLHPTDGIISGTPTVAGTTPVTIRVTDALNAQASQTYQMSVIEIQPPGPGTHEYFNTLSARSDLFAAYSLRTQAMLEQYKKPTTGALRINYVYPNDPDPRKQDAAKILLPEGVVSLGTEIHLPIGPHFPNNLFVTFDVWWGTEWTFGPNAYNDGSKIVNAKGCPVSLSPTGDGQTWVGMRTGYILAQQHVSNQPPGGPYVGFSWPQAAFAAAIKNPPYATAGEPDWWTDGQEGFPLGQLPYNVPSNQTRIYEEAVQKFDTSIYTPGQEFGIVPERWTRYWHFFIRAAEEDYFKVYQGQLRLFRMYRWYVWGADTVRAPFRVLNGALCSIHPNSPGGFRFCIIRWQPGGASDGGMYVGRGALVAYTKNYVALNPASLAVAESLLQQPVA